MQRGFLKYACFASALVGCVASSAAVGQQAYPNRPIRMIVPFAAGGSTDSLARTVAQKLSESLRQTVFVENRAGGNAVIGSDALRLSAADGYTIMVTSVDHTVIPQLLPTPYHPIRDFAPVGAVSYTQMLLVANPSLPANNVQEVLALAKSKPNELNYSSSGTGGVPHLTGELLGKLTGAKIQHVPYKGGGPAMIDLIGGQVQLNMGPPINAIPYIKSGQAKPIAITGTRRLEALPQVPTFEESGVSGLDVKTWFAMFAPAQTSKAIIDRLSQELIKVLARADVKEVLAGQGMEPYPLTAEEFAAVVKADYAKYGEIIRARNIKLEN